MFMRFLSATIIGLLLIFCLSCQGALNAKCKYNEKGILSYRNSGSIIAFFYVWKPGEHRANPMIKLGDNLINEEIIKKRLRFSIRLKWVEPNVLGAEFQLVSGRKGQLNTIVKRVFLFGFRMEILSELGSCQNP